MEIEELLRKLIGATDFFSKIGIAYDIDTSKRTCSVQLKNGDADLHAVRLQALQEIDAGVVFVPADKSDVIVGFLDEDEAFVLSTSKLSSVSIITEGNISLNGDEFGGLIKIEELKTQMNKNSEILKAIQNVISGVSIPEPGNGNPSALQTALSAVITSKQTANLDDIENKTVKHG